MHVVFVEPRFPANQKQFIQGLAEVGAEITAIGEGSKDSLDGDLKRWLMHYEEVRNVTDEGQVLNALKFIQSRKHVDRLEATVEAFIEGHEGFYDTLSIKGEVVHEFATHYYPNVLEAMRTRWISPQFIATNRIDSAPGYDDVKAMGRKVVKLLGIETSATHME